MKPVIFVILFTISGLSAQTQELLSINKPFQVMSYNIRFDNPGDGANTWSNRKQKVFSILRLYKPDIIGFQEPLQNQIADLHDEFRQFSWFGVGRDDGRDKGEFNPIFYNSARFELLNSGTFWLSETPDIPGSKSWYALLPRICTWVKLKDKFSNDSLYAFNTHFDHGGKTSRVESAKLLLRKISEIAGTLPVIVTGDFNDDEKSETYSILINENVKNHLVNTMYASRYPHHGGTFTYVGFDFIGVPGKIIDFIYVKNNLKVKFHAFLTDTWDGTYASDHIPVFTELEIR